MIGKCAAVANRDFNTEGTEFAESEKRRPPEGEDWVGAVLVGRNIANDSTNSYYLSIVFLFTSQLSRMRSLDSHRDRGSFVE